MVAAKANEATNSVIGIPNMLATVPHMKISREDLVIDLSIKCADILMMATSTLEISHRINNDLSLSNETYSVLII